MAERSGLRIALLTYSTKPRGSVLHTLELATALQGLGHSVTVYALDKEGSGFDYPLRCSAYLIPAQAVAGGMDALIQQRIQEFVEFLNPDHLRHQGYDCYHAQDCIGANALLTLRERGKFPTLFAPCTMWKPSPVPICRPARTVPSRPPICA
jgi:hypothetical protein